MKLILKVPHLVKNMYWFDLAFKQVALHDDDGKFIKNLKINKRWSIKKYKGFWNKIYLLKPRRCKPKLNHFIEKQLIELESYTKGEY